MSENENELEKELETAADETALDDNSENNKEVEYESNDNWQFEAEAPTLSDDIFASKEYSVDPSALKVEGNYNAVPEAAANTGDVVIKREKVEFSVLAVLVLAIIAVLVFLGIRYNTVPNGKEGRLMNPASVVATVDNYKVSVGMFDYYYANIVNYYEQNAANLGLNTSADYATQYTQDSDGNKISWRAFFEQEAMKEIKNITLYYNAGLKAGLTINKQQQEIIDSYIENAKTSASAQSMSLDQYLQSYYGEYCTEDTLRLFYEQYFISAVYQGYYAAQQSFDEEDADSYFSEHKNDYCYSNCSFLAVEYDATDDTTKAKSQQAINSCMSKITDRDSMIALIPELYKDYIEQDAASAMEYDSSLSKEDAVKQATDSYKGSIDVQLGYDASSGEVYAPFGDDINKWLFSDETEIGEKTYYIDESIGYAYIILKLEKPSLNEDTTYSVRHILIQPKADDEEKQQNLEFTDEQWAEAEKNANAILDEFNSGEKTELSFALLAEDKSEDTASTAAGLSGYYGGLYEGVFKDAMVPQFEKWALDDSRKYADTGIVKTDYGYHIMYFVNQLPSYKSSIISKLKLDAVEKSVEDTDFNIHESVLERTIDQFYASREQTAAQ